MTDSSAPLAPALLSEPPALEVVGVDAGYEHTVVLHGVSLTVPAGSVTALLGPNGAGKSTLLKVVSGLIRPTAGSVTVRGTDVTAFTPYRRAGLGVCHIPEG